MNDNKCIFLCVLSICVAFSSAFFWCNLEENLGVIFNFIARADNL